MSSVDALVRDRNFALTLIERTDREYCDRLQTSLVRGGSELLYWGVGPTLRRGDIVALYTPNSKYLPDSEHSCIRRLYFAAADSTPGSRWKQHVFLSQAVSLNPPLSSKDLDGLGISSLRLLSAGRSIEPMATDMTRRFLAAAAERCRGGIEQLVTLAERAKKSPDLCISYSGHDWTQAQRLKIWLDDLAPFFVSPVGKVLSDEAAPLERLLRQVFSNAAVVVCLVPTTGRISKWVRLEMQTAMKYARRVIFVRTDRKLPWPVPDRMAKVRRYTLRPPGERELVERVRDALAATSAADGGE